jgi:hypothetical protein
MGDSRVDDRKLGAAVLGAAVAGLLGLWISGVLLGIIFAAVGAVVLPAVVGARR